MLNIKQELSNLRESIEDAFLQLHMIKITPMDNRAKNFSSVLKMQKTAIRVAKIKIKNILKMECGL